jgi:DNA polymerase-1
MNSRYLNILREVEREREQGIGSSKDSHLLVIDGLNTFIRVFSAVPALNDDGAHIGGVTGFLRSIAANIRQLKPTRCVIIFDGKGGSKRRKKIYPEYKANRANKTAFNRYQEFASLEDEQDSMRRQFGRLVEYLNCLPITTLAIDNVEADDIMAYIANEIYTDDKNRVTICSTDRDFLQLVNNRISVWSPIKKKLYTPELMKEEFGFNSSNYLLYRAFIGDKSDNIPGLKGVGPKSLLKYFPMITEDREVSIKELVDHADSIEKPYKVHKLVSENKKLLELNYRLMQLKEVDINGGAKMLTLNKVTGDIDRMNVLEFKKMFMVDKMYTVIKDLDSWLTNSFNSLNAYASMHKN